MIGKKLSNKNGYIGVITEYEDTCYHPEHSKDNPWITITYTYNGYENKNVGCLKTLLQDWTFIN